MYSYRTNQHPSIIRQKSRYYNETMLIIGFELIHFVLLIMDINIYWILFDAYVHKSWRYNDDIHILLLFHVVVPSIVLDMWSKIVQITNVFYLFYTVFSMLFIFCSYYILWHVQRNAYDSLILSAKYSYTIY
eukprot:419047_1